MPAGGGHGEHELFGGSPAEADSEGILELRAPADLAFLGRELPAGRTLGSELRAVVETTLDPSGILGISSMPELLAALQDQRLRDLTGWGERSEANLATAIRRAQEAGGRIPLAVALDVAEGLVAQLAQVPGVDRAAYAGSLRRMRDTVGDIDVLVAAARSTPVMDVFCSLPQVGQVLADGTTRSAVVTTSGIQVDVRVVDPQVWGAALLYFTGSAVRPRLRPRRERGRSEAR